MSVHLPAAKPTTLGYESTDPRSRLRVGTLLYTTTGLAVLFCWLLWGDFAWNVKERAIGPVAQVMLRSFESPDWLVGLLVGSIPAGIGMVLGPIISVRSDRHRGRWARRIPFLLIPTPFVSFHAATVVVCLQAFIDFRRVTGP